MAHVSILDREDTGILDALACHKRSGQFFPIVRDGQIAAFVSRFAVERVQIPTPLTVSDFIDGLEALGFRFQIYGPADRPCCGMAMPDETIPTPWNDYALRLEAAFDRRERKAEIIAFLTREA